MESLDAWIEGQYRHCAASMLTSVSCTVVKTRAGFGQIIRPSKGSIVASPVPAAYDPEPDYFFHWYRDSAIVVDAMRVLSETSPVAAGDQAAQDTVREHFCDYVNFSLALQQQGHGLVEDAGWRARVSAAFEGYTRSDAEIDGVRGDAISADTRVNPDGSVDISRWPRPQYDGTALRALTVLRWLRTHRFDPAQTAAAESLLRADLARVLEFGRQPCFDIWEEELGLHYYTLRVSAAALHSGSQWQHGDPAAAKLHALAAGEILDQLDGYWRSDRGYFRSRQLAHGMPEKELDFAVILSLIHSDADARHSASDSRAHATLAQLERLFDTTYPINRERGQRHAPAMGRYKGDRYFSGGAYYFSTLGAAEFYFQAAARAAEPRALLERGDAFLRTVRKFTPASGDLAEQFDQVDGAPRSARHLAWSYAAFISCIAARRRARRALG